MTNSWAGISDSDMKGQGFSLLLQISKRELQHCQEFIIQSLETALQINKELLLHSLYSSYLPSGINFSPSLLPEAQENKCSSQEPKKKDNDREPPRENLRRKLRLKKKRENYDTKNIPKNFGTAIHIYIKRNSARVKNLLAKKKVSYSQFYEFNKEAKERINSLLHLRELWQTKEDESDRNMKECYRIISFEFMRKHCLSYIFGSRIKNIGSHIRYRKKLLEGIERPHTLFNLKDY